MKKVMKFSVLVLVTVAFSLAVVGCKSHGDHPKGDHPKAEHPEGEHPK